jgi:hypothetical protein
MYKGKAAYNDVVQTKDMQIAQVGQRFGAALAAVVSLPRNGRGTMHDLTACADVKFDLGMECKQNRQISVQ